MAYSSFPPEVGGHSPWGTIEAITPLGPDAVAFGTEYRGGIFVSPNALERLGEATKWTHFSGEPGWFEQDSDWALPYVALGLDRFEADPVKAAERWASALRRVEDFYPERLAALAAVLERDLERASVRERLLEAAERYASQVVDSPTRDGAGGVGVDDVPASELELPDELFLDRSELSDLQLVNRCKYVIVSAQFFVDPSPTEGLEMAKADLAAAKERPAIRAAFADSFVHPDMVAQRLEKPTDEDGMLAASELLTNVRNALVDQLAAAETRAVLGTLKRLQGPTPWDTFYEVPGEPAGALMPLYGHRNSDVLGLGPIDRPGQRWSDGQQALFYPVGGYDRFAAATLVVVAQTLADGLAIEAALQSDEACAVVVTSDPDNVHEVCFDVNVQMSKRAAVAGGAEREPVSVVAALAQWDGPDNEAIKRLVLDAPRTGTSIIRPNSTPADSLISWHGLESDIIAEAVRSGRVASSLKMEEIAALPDPGGFDYGAGFRESVRELRESVRDAAPILTADAPKLEKEQTRSVSRRM